MTVLDEPATGNTTVQQFQPTAETPDKPVVVTRRRIDKVLIGFGVLATGVFAVAGGLLTWGANFSDDYVHDELASQNITMPDADTLREEGLEEFVKWADTPLDSGAKAEAYAQYIGGHLENIGGGLTYSEYGKVENEAKAAVTAAQEAGASDEEVAALQEEAAAASNTRNTLFKGETLRGLLLSAYAWSTVGQIAGYAAIGAFVAAGLMAILVVMGVVHYGRMTHQKDVMTA